MAKDFSREKGLDEKALARYAGGQGAIADGFGSALLNLLGEEAFDGADLDLGAVISPTSLEALLIHHVQADSPLPAATVSFEDGQPEIRAVSEEPTNGSSREIVAQLDAQGALQGSVDIVTAADGSQEITEASPHPVGSHLTLIRKDAQGQVLETHEMDVLVIRDAVSGSERLKTLIRYHADGNATITLTRMAEDGTILSTHEAETESVTRGEKVALFELADGSTHEARLYFDSQDSNGEDVPHEDASGEGEGQEGEQSGGASQRLDAVVVTHSRETHPQASTSATYYADGSSETRDYERLENGDQVTTLVQHHLDGSITKEVETQVFGGDHVRQGERRSADGRLLEETHVVDVPNGDFTETVTVHHEDGSRHATMRRRDRDWKLVETSETMTFADGSQTIETETYPDGGRQTVLANKDAEGAWVDERITLIRQDETQRVENRTYHPDGRYESFVEERSPEGTITGRTETLRQPTADGGTQFRSFEISSGGTIETLITHDANGKMLRRSVVGTSPEGGSGKVYETWSADGSQYRRVQLQTAADGSIQTHSEKTVETGADGTQKTEEVDYRSDGSFTREIQLYHPARETYETSRVETTPQADGTLKIVGTTWEGHYAGPRTDSEIIQDEDGRILSSTSTRSGEGGQLVTHVLTPQPDGSTLEVMTYQEPFKCTTVTTTTAPDGSRSVHHVEKDAEQRVLREENHEVDADGTVRESIVTEHAGERTTITRTTRDADGRTESLREERDSQDMLRRTLEQLTISDGSQVETDRYFENGRLTSELIETTDPEGKFLESISTIVTQEPDGSERVQVVTTRADGRDTWVTTTTKNGEIVQRITDETEASGARSYQEWSLDGKGATSESMRRWDADGKLVEDSGHQISTDENGIREIKTWREVAGEPKHSRITRTAADGTLLSYEDSLRHPDGSLIHEEMTRQADGTTRVETQTYGPGSDLQESRTTETKPALDGGKTIRIFSQRTGEGWREDVIQQDAAGEILNQTASTSRSHTDEAGIKTIETTVQQADGSRREVTEIWDEGSLRERHVTRTETDENGVETHRTEVTHQDGARRETLTATHPDGLVVEEVFDRFQDGRTLRVTTRRQGAQILETTRVSTFLDANFDRIVETIVTRHDGSSEKRTLVTNAANVQTQTETVTAADGSETVRTIATHFDGSRREQLTRKDRDGETIETATTETASDGSSSEVVTTRQPDGGTLTVTTRRAADGQVLETITTRTHADGRVVETQVTSSADGHSREVRKETDADGDWVSTRIETTNAADESRMIELSTPESDGSIRTVLTREDAQGNLLDRIESVTTQTTGIGGLPATSVHSTFLDGTTREVLTTTTESGQFVESKVIEISEDALGNTVTRTVTTGAIGRRVEEIQVKNAAGDELHTSRLETDGGGSTTHASRELRADGSMREEEGRKAADGKILAWTITETVPQSDGTWTITIETQDGNRSTRVQVLRRDAKGHETELSNELSTWTQRITTERDLPGIAERETVLYLAEEDGETVLEQRITTIAEDGSKTVEFWHHVGDLQRIETYDPAGKLRARTVRETDANGRTHTIETTYRADGSPELETSETRSASEVLLASRKTLFEPDGKRTEIWEDHSRAELWQRVETRQAADGTVLATTETERRQLPDGSTLEKIRAISEDGARLVSERLTRENTELRFESEHRGADGALEIIRRERFADGSSRDYTLVRTDDSVQTVTITRDANGVESVETYDETFASDENSASDYTRRVIVKDGEGNLLSESERRRDPIVGRYERDRIYDAEGYSEQETTHSPDGDIREVSQRVGPSDKLIEKTDSHTLPDGSREANIYAYDSDGKLQRWETTTHNRHGALAETVVRDYQPDGGRIDLTKKPIPGGEEETRIVWDAGDQEIERSSVSQTQVYDYETKTTIHTRKETRADGTVFERQERVDLFGTVLEATETLTETDQGQVITHTHDIGYRRDSAGDLVRQFWTETETRIGPNEEILETTVKKTTLLDGGGMRQDQQITRQDGTSRTDFRIVDAQDEVLEFRTVDRTPLADGATEQHTVAAFRDGTTRDEVIVFAADGSRTITEKTTSPSGDVRLVETQFAPDATVLERTETLTREDGSKVVKTYTNTLHGAPDSGTIVETEEAYDASQTLTQSTSTTTFANGSRFEKSLSISDGEREERQVEFEAGGRRLHDFSETTHADGRRTIVSSTEHIDGSIERITTTLDAGGERLDYQHTLDDSAGRTHRFDDPHTPAKRPALVSVEKTFIPEGYFGPNEYEQTVYRYSDDTIINEEQEFSVRYGERRLRHHVKFIKGSGLLYEWTFTGGGTLQAVDWQATKVGNFRSITLKGNASTEYVLWHGEKTEVIQRSTQTKGVISIGSYAAVGADDFAFHFASPDGSWEISGVKGREAVLRNLLHDPRSEVGLLRSTETILDRAAGTKHVIERAPGPDGGYQRADLHYTLQEDGSYLRKSSRVATTYSDKSTLLVERSFDDEGKIAHESHRYESANGNRIVETTITHHGDGASTRKSTFTLSGSVSKIETVETRVSGKIETVETKTTDRHDKLLEWTIAETTDGKVQVTTTYHPGTGAVTKVETADVSVVTHPDGRVEKVIKALDSDTITTLRWGPSGEYAGGSKVHTSSDGKLVTTELFTPEGNKTITLIEKENGQITAITTSHLDPFGYASNVSRTENLAIRDPLSKVAADQLLSAMGFTFVTQPDGSQKIDFSKRVAGVPFTVDGLDFSQIGIDLDRNPIETMTDAFTEIASGKASPENYAKLLGSLVLTVKDAKGNPGVMAGYLAFCGIDLALKETPFGQQWLSIKKELNEYLNVGIQGGAFGAVDVAFKFIDDLAGGAASKWLQDNGLGNALDALMNPNVLLGTPGEMIADMARTLMTGGAYLPVKFLYNMMPDGVQAVIDDALRHVPGYSQVAYGLGLATGYIDDGLHTGLSYAQKYAQVGIEEAFNAQNYVIAADAFISLSEDFAGYATTYGNLVGKSMTSAFGKVVDVTKGFANLMSDIATQGVAAASQLANQVYGGLKSLGNAIADGASDAWNAVSDGFKKATSWLPF